MDQGGQSFLHRAFTFDIQVACTAEQNAPVAIAEIVEALVHVEGAPKAKGWNRRREQDLAAGRHHIQLRHQGWREAVGGHRDALGGDHRPITEDEVHMRGIRCDPGHISVPSDQHAFFLCLLHQASNELRGINRAFEFSPGQMIDPAQAEMLDEVIGPAEGGGTGDRPHHIVEPLEPFGDRRVQRIARHERLMSTRCLITDPFITQFGPELQQAMPAFFSALQRDRFTFFIEVVQQLARAPEAREAGVPHRCSVRKGGPFKHHHSMLGMPPLVEKRDEQANDSRADDHQIGLAVEGALLPEAMHGDRVAVKDVLNCGSSAAGREPHPLNASKLQYTWKRGVASMACLLLFVAAWSQVDVVMVFGTVKDLTTAKKIDGVVISVFKNGAKLVEVPTNASGKYEVNLDYGSEYKVMCSKKGFVSKNIVIDTRNIPEEERQGGHGMNIDFTMLSEIPGVDFSILQEAFGKAKYVGATGNFEWDMEYTNRMRDAQARLLKEYDERKKREANAEAEFAKLMTQGSTAMGASDFKKAVESFTEALTLKVGDAVATAKLSDARMRLEASEGAKKLDEEYAALIKEADGLFGKKSYEPAKAKYEAALDIKENEAHPKQRVKEIDTILADLAKKAEEEKKAKELQQKYDAAIAAADAAFKAENWDQATTKYTEAGGLKPEERYPKDQIAAIAKKKEELAKKAEDEKKARELQQKYDAAIAAGDAAFKANSWDIATTKYTEAGTLKPEEKYPKDQLAAIAAKKEEEKRKADEERLAKENQQKYQAAIAAADIAFNGARYDDAETKYNEAIGFKPEEKYPKDQLAAIAKKREELAAKAEEERKAKDLDAQYQAALAAAMQSFTGERYDEAIAKYTEASSLKPKEQYPKDQIALINKKKEELAKKAEEERKAKELQDKYDAAVVAADAALNAEDWTAATAKYTEASTLKPGERYPKDQLAVVAQRKAAAEERKRQEEVKARYDAIIAVADGAFDKEDFATAKTKYTEASSLLPAERYPKDRIAESEARMAEKAKREEEERLARERDAKYQELISRADKAYGSEKLSAALVDYKDAAALKPDEAHPRERIIDIESKMDAAAKARAEEERLAREKAEQDKRYGELIAAADRDFTAKKYEQARTSYTEALAVKPEEQKPKDRLTEIERILAELAEKDAAARDAAAKAAADRAAKEAADKLAAELAAAEKARLEEEARRKKSEEEALMQQYREAIAAGDLAFTQESFDQARERFTEALGLRPQEKYPKDRLAAIDAEVAKRELNRSEAERLAEQRRKEEEERRRKEAEDAERARLAADAERARLEAERKAQEDADAEARRLAEERDRLARGEAKALDERYRSALVSADEAMASKDYPRARGLYAEASDLKPQETYPLAKIDQIDRLLAELERQRQEAELAARKAAEDDSQRRTRPSTSIDRSNEQQAEEFMRKAREREEFEKWQRIKKQREDVMAEEASNATDASARRNGAVNEKERIVDGQAGLYRGDETRRELSAAEVQALKDRVAESELQRRDRSGQVSAQQYDLKVATQERVLSREQDLSTRQVQAASTVVEQSNAIRTAESQRASASAQRSSSQRSQVEQVIEQEADRRRKGAAQSEERLRAIDDAKRATIAREAGYVQGNDVARARNKAALDATPVDQPRDFADYNRNKLAQEYPPGVTEESYTEGNKVIIRRVVVNGNRGDEYSKVIAKWGIFYFKNGQSITEAIWTRETEG